MSDTRTMAVVGGVSLPSAPGTPAADRSVAPAAGPAPAVTTRAGAAADTGKRAGKASGRPRRRAGAPVPAAVARVARVAVDVGLPHLDRPFDYLVPEHLDAHVAVGSRVRVRFAGRLVDGFVLDRGEASQHAGALAFVARSVSAERVLTREVAALARAVADRYGGSLADVLRMAVPPRHARAENRDAAVGPATVPRSPPPGSWASYPGGPRFLAALAAGQPARAVWWALPGPDWPREVAVAVQATLSAGKGAVVVLPDRRDVARVAAALDDAIGAERFVVLSAELGPAERYRRFLLVSRAEVRAVVGTRAAAFAPVADLGLAVVWDDGDDLHAEPRTPYPHVRDILALRAQRADAALLIGGFSPSVEAQALLSVGWAHQLAGTRTAVRAASPRVEATGSEVELARDPAARAARLPSLAWAAARAALAAGAPVLIQVPRRGYQPALACADCRRPARCPRCAGPLARRAAGSNPPACRWCGRPVLAWRCPGCGSARLRAVAVGDRRTAEELGRSFPGVPVHISGRDAVLATVSAEPALVVATPGAEPIAEAGYGAVLLLDAWALLGRPDLRAAEEALRRWTAAAALARSAGEGGRVVVTADASLAAVQALIRWDPGWFTGREADERAALGFPPASRMASVEGPPVAVADVLATLDLPVGAAVLGPVPAPAGERVLVRVSREQGGALAAAVKMVQGVRSARKAEPARVQLDPLMLA